MVLIPCGRVGQVGSLSIDCLSFFVFALFHIPFTRRVGLTHFLGWSHIQESVATGDRQILTLLMARLKDVMTDRFEQKIPIAIEALQKV